MPHDAISLDEKRQALERLLTSRALGRSERLRAFLRYICEAEFEGRAQEINEYALGVSVLGRPADYSPGDDSSVRSRAYELRNKLRAYYETEAPDDPVRIEIDKGGYVPRFVRPPRPPEPPSPAPPPLAPAPAPTRRRVGLYAGVAAALLVAGAAILALARNRQPPQDAHRSPLTTPEMAALWGPFLDTEAPLIVSFETRLFFYAPGTGLVVRDYQTNTAADAAKSRPLLAFQEHMGAPKLEERFDYSDFGAVHAGFLLGRLLDRPVGLKDSGSLGWQDLWNSNIVFLGKPTLHPAIRYSLDGKDFVGTEDGSGIRNLHPRPGEPELFHNASTHGAGQKYGLITVLPGPQAGRRMMILSGSAAELMWALAEAVTNPTRVHEMLSHVVSPSGQLPPAFQIVIAATFESNVPVDIRYVTHRTSAR